MKTTFDGVRREAERRRALKGDYAKVRDLTKDDFFSYATLALATGVDFSYSDALAFSLGVSNDTLALNAVEF